MDIAMVIALIEKILTYGVPAVVRAIQAWDVEEPTLEDIQGLKVRAPEEYFEDD